jgi:acetylornithine deacetylase/succinyl-diaminopimelate desuccinylase-like protein
MTASGHSSTNDKPAPGNQRAANRRNWIGLPLRSGDPALRLHRREPAAPAPSISGSDARGGQFAPGMTDEGATVISELRRAHGAVSGQPQRTWGAPYGSDLRLMTGTAGVPTVHYGPGDVRLAHGPLERVPAEEVLTATRALAVLALEHCTGAEADGGHVPFT